MPLVSPAQAGVQGRATRRLPWVPAFAGKTLKRWELYTFTPLSEYWSHLP